MYVRATYTEKNPAWPLAVGQQLLQNACRQSPSSRRVLASAVTQLTLVFGGAHWGLDSCACGCREGFGYREGEPTQSPIAMPGKRSRAIAAALSHPDLSPAPGLVLAPVFTAASAAPAAPSSPLPDWPAPTGECPPHPQRSPLIAASLAHLPSRLDVAASSCPQVGTRPGTIIPACSFHAFSCRPRRNEHRRCTSARPARVASRVLVTCECTRR